MEMFFYNLSERFAGVMPEFLEEKGITIGNRGLSVNIVVDHGNGIRIDKKDNQVNLILGKERYIFRAITHLLQHRRETDYVYEEKCWLDTCGFMYDGSQASSVLNVESCKKMLRTLAGMGYNMMMLYCEDCYEVPAEPNWANMRPRYTQAEFREIDDYAYALGIEMIPCIQVLAHFKDVLKRADYRCVADTAIVLKVGAKRTYELIENLIASVSSCFRTKRIHLNMDEAWDIGLGNYLQENGYKAKFALMREHVSYVTEITNKYGLKPMMWSDMFFASKSKTGDYYDDSIIFDEEDIKGVPDNMELVLWDYYHDDAKIYESMINLHNTLNGGCWVATACRCGWSFGANYNAFFKRTTTALQVCKKMGVKEVFTCVWGDNHRESSPFAVLPQLQTFAEYVYNDAPDEEFIARRFAASTGEDWNAFRTYDGMDCVPEYNGNNKDDSKLSHLCMWQDILLGLFDSNLRGMDFSLHYEDLAYKFRTCAANSGSYSSMFEFAEKTAKVLSLKAYMGIRLAKAYRENNRVDMEIIANKDLPKLSEYMMELRNINRSYFFEIYKPLGWEALDIRYGGAIMRIDTAIMRINDYLEGRISKIEELEENRIDWYMDGQFNSTTAFIDYSLICSPSSL